MNIVRQACVEKLSRRHCVAQQPTTTLPLFVGGFWIGGRSVGDGVAGMELAREHGHLPVPVVRAIDLVPPSRVASCPPPVHSGYFKPRFEGLFVGK